MKTRIARKTGTALVTIGIAAGVLGVGWSGSAGADIPKRVGTQIRDSPSAGQRRGRRGRGTPADRASVFDVTLSV